MRKPKMQPPQHDFDLSSVEALVRRGKVVVSAEDSTILATVLKTISDGRIATFYVTRELYAQIMMQHWTPERVKRAGLKPVSDEEIARIKSELALDVSGAYSNIIECPKCGHVYGMYEFLQQGIHEHGRAAVDSVFSLNDGAVVRVNPMQRPVCPKCQATIIVSSGDRWGHYYICREYGCCQWP